MIQSGDPKRPVVVNHIQVWAAAPPPQVSVEPKYGRKGTVTTCFALIGLATWERAGLTVL